MRIIAGSLKGRRLKAPTWEGLRPTSDKLRETLFNVLASRVAGARVLDAFAGTGALGLEALSRGAAAVTYVESDRRAQALIAANVAHCRVENCCAIIRASVARAIRSFATPTGGRSVTAPFDIVLLDPPYDYPPDKILKDVDAVVAPHGVVVLEHARRQPTPAALGRLVRVREVTSGDSGLSLYEVSEEKSEVSKFHV
jgi:16S rRNA (guanine(966)-N(2))-methyltransferase RsmD